MNGTANIGTYQGALRAMIRGSQGMTGTLAAGRTVFAVITRQSYARSPRWITQLLGTETVSYKMVGIFLYCKVNLLDIISNKKCRKKSAKKAKVQVGRARRIISIMNHWQMLVINKCCQDPWHKLRSQQGPFIPTWKEKRRAMPEGCKSNSPAVAPIKGAWRRVHVCSSSDAPLVNSVWIRAVKLLLKTDCTRR